MARRVCRVQPTGLNKVVSLPMSLWASLLECVNLVYKQCCAAEVNTGWHHVSRGLWGHGGGEWRTVIRLMEVQWGWSSSPGVECDGVHSDSIWFSIFDVCCYWSIMYYWAMSQLGSWQLMTYRKYCNIYFFSVLKGLVHVAFNLENLSQLHTLYAVILLKAVN